MTRVFIKFGNEIHSVDISPETHALLRDGANLRKRALGYFLNCIVEEYGTLTEENIKKFMEEKWVL